MSGERDLSPLGSLRVVGAFSRGLLALRRLDALMGASRVVASPSPRQARELDAVVGWGHKRTANRARAYAARHQLPYVALEDGFLRSVALDGPPASLVLDDIGIYYDASVPSRVERLLVGEGDWLKDPALLARARGCRERIVEAGVSKYNDAPARLPKGWPGDGRPIVLVVDQTYGDGSVAGGLATAASFQRMLAAAKREHPGARVVVKLHPATVAGHKRGYLAGARLDSSVEVLGEAVNPMALLAHVSHVYVCTSQVGFEALMAGKRVTCFGVPFYAGWGLTDDRVRVPRRGRSRSIDELVAAALLLYPRYVHPITGRRCEAEDVIEHLALQRRMFEANARRFYCLGFSRWKRPFVRRFLASPGCKPEFLNGRKELSRCNGDDNAAVVVWSSRTRGSALQGVAGASLPVFRMEDGFLRSVRLGSELSAPGSLVLDSRGIYYDPSVSSDLEEILEHGSFSEGEIARASRLRKRIVELGVSKYNPPGRERVTLQAKCDQPVVLVPGQVRDDASIRAGCDRIRSDADLLREVRRARPDSFVLYKPHPDVVSGNRGGGRRLRASERLWDERVGDVSVAACLSKAHEVHTMTSLVGFEALLRGLRVVTYGRPFYAGWGLTEDRVPLERRRRRLTLDELVAGALIRYPRYFSWRARAFCTPEEMVEELAAGRTPGGVWLLQLPWLVRRARDAALLMRELAHA